MLAIGPIQLELPFLQAALSGYSDLPMRRLARRYGAPYALNEVVLDKFVIQSGKKAKAILSVPDDDHPVGGQLMGASPEDFAPAALAMALAGYDVIDINLGCPVRKVLSRCRGGYLLSQPAVALDIIRRVFDAVGSFRPVTVKMRRGMDDTPQSERNFFTIFDGALAIGVSAVTVHGRTVVQRYEGPSNWGFLAKVKQRAGDRMIIGSGDLFTAQACVQMIRETGVDAVAIARGCIGNPWIFRQFRSLWQGRPLGPPPSIAEQREAIQYHWGESRRVHGDRLAGKLMRKFGIKYAEHHPCGRPVRDAFIAMRSHDDFARVLDTWYAPAVDWPPVTHRTHPGHLIAAGARGP